MHVEARPRADSIRHDYIAMLPVRRLSRAPAADERSRDDISSPWLVILIFGGLVWLVVTWAALMWMLPWSGTAVEGGYAPTTFAHAIQHLLIFLVAAVAYRISIALGWPRYPMQRVRVICMNGLLALVIVIWADVAVNLASGYVDGHMQDMRESMRELPHFFANQHLWTTAVRFYLPPYVLGLCAVALVMVASRQQRDALRSAELSRAYAAARMAMLSAQLQPHFLFNSLNAVMGLIEVSPEQASTMVARLGDFLRHALETSHSPWVDIATELTGVEAYLAVQQARFAGHLKTTMDVAPPVLGLYMPSLLLQPLVENAIEHGRVEARAALHVHLSFERREERLCIAVSNSRPRLLRALTPDEYGRGLKNVELRLQAAYGNDAHMSVGPGSEDGTMVLLNLPLRYRTDIEETRA